jgi:RNA polymerase sigma factor (sigma-70 family)
VDKNSRIVEDLLYSYRSLKVEIKNIDLEINQLENEYQGCSSIGYEERSSPTNKFNSSVENEMLAKRFRPEYLKKRKEKIITQIQQMDNAIEILLSREQDIIRLRYFEKISNKDIAAKLDLTEQRVSGIKTEIIKKIAPLILIF